jgi:hypothetical protein
VAVFVERKTEDRHPQAIESSRFALLPSDVLRLVKE